MASVSLCFSPAALSFGAGLPQDIIDAFAYTLTKAQSVARNTGADPASHAYFDAMVGELRRLGWGNLPWQQAALQPFTHQPGGPPVSPLALAVQAIEAFLGQILPPLEGALPDAAWLARLAGPLEHPPPDIEAALDRWWSGTQIHARGQAMSISSLANFFGTPFMVGGYFVYALDGAQWRALLEPAASVGLTSYPLALLLDMAVYRTLQAGLAAELKDQVQQTICHATLDLGAIATWQET